MPLVEKIEYQGISQVGVWEMNENIDFFVDHPHIDKQDRSETQGLSDRRLLEWSAGRYLLYYILDQDEPPKCRKNIIGKPYLDGSELEISMSHSGSLVAASTSLFKNGIDIQRIVPKITRIRHKYMHPDEIESLDDPNDLISLHIYWGAKESLYKAFGKRKVSFKHNIRINPFNATGDHGKTIGYVRHQATFETYQINWKKIKHDYILVFADQLL